MAIFAFGYALLFLNYGRFGGIIDFFDIGSRADRNYQMREQLGNYPFSTVLYAAFVVGLVVEYFAKGDYGHRRPKGPVFVFLLISPLMRYILLMANGRIF